ADSRPAAPLRMQFTLLTERVSLKALHWRSECRVGWRGPPRLDLQVGRATPVDVRQALRCAEVCWSAAIRRSASARYVRAWSNEQRLSPLPPVASSRGAP